jgi:hypothetical protein
MQWCSLVGCCSLGGDDCRPHRPQPGVWDVEPATGHLPRDLAVVLAEVLAGQTTTPQRCWFAVWDGFGDLAVPEQAGAGCAVVCGPAAAHAAAQRRDWGRGDLVVGRDAGLAVAEPVVAR